MTFKRLIFLSLGLFMILESTASAQLPRPGFSMDYAFRSPLIWRVGNRSIVFDYKNKSETVIRDGETVVYSLPFPKVVTGIIASEDKTTLLIIISLVQKDGGWNYDRLMILRKEAADEIVVSYECLLMNEPEIDQKWVVELGAISDDGRVALVKMGVPDGDRPPYNVNHVWETWDLKSQKRVGIGIKLCD